MHIRMNICNTCNSRSKIRCVCRWNGDDRYFKFWCGLALLALLIELFHPTVVIQSWTPHHPHHPYRPSANIKRFITIAQMSSSSSGGSNSGQQQVASSRPKGSAAVPYQKQKIITMGNGGYLGGLLFGYLQRASTIYGTGIGGGSSSSIRSIGATPDTSIRLNRVLNKHFVLANADESCIKLTNLSCINAIEQRMIGYDAMVLGTNLYLEQKIVAASTYEVTPNDKACVFFHLLLA